MGLDRNYHLSFRQNDESQMEYKARLIAIERWQGLLRLRLELSHVVVHELVWMALEYRREEKK